MTPLVHALIRAGAAWPSAKAIADLVDAGLLWTGGQHAALARPPHRSLARRLRANREEIARLNALAVGLVGQLIAHERLTGDPVFLLNRHTGFDTIVNVQSSFRLPRYSDEHDFDALVEVMLANDLILEEPTTKLLRRVGYTNGWWPPARNPRA